MAAKNERSKLLRAVRQLRRVRAFYAAGAVLWAALAAWVGWERPGSRQMWVSVLLLVVFTGLLSVASVWLSRLRAAGADRPAHHALPRRTALRRHANA
ncbi:hypothetical protein [Streptomyces minutiscleroticus]|uniref:Uncharacterized protein n=1 Tax=Streptomyces minutiscleroticus TaxID=68238 RepID=A0A918NAT8_9ACTN|nr:hypothetical protein [Streptomyces minutiscleroticus]GGX59080.1 hypothetical protein GCM10010358_11660 [Streptomyces minutiscleroticus]